MTHFAEPAKAQTPLQDLAQLLWHTDPALNSFMFQRMSVLLDVLTCEWPAERGLLCHRQAFTIVQEHNLLGLLIGHTAEEYGPNFEAALELQMGRLSEDDEKHLATALIWMDRLFPTPRPGSYYVLELSTAPSVRGQGLATVLLDAAEGRALQNGCSHICLDVAADNDAVSFYRHKGFQVEIETRVPYLHDTHGIGLHLHMERRLSASA